MVRYRDTGLENVINRRSYLDPDVVAAIRNACFGYFKLGGICVSGPMSLLSGYVQILRYIIPR